MEACYLKPGGGARVSWVHSFSLSGGGLSITLPNPSGQDTFAGLRAWLIRLEGECIGKRTASEFQRLRLELDYVSPKSAHEISHSGILTSGVAFAVLRRISRESVYTGRLIDSAARTLLMAIDDIDASDILVESVDQLDRPSLKILFRMALIAVGKTRHWQWRFSADPFCADGSVWSHSRVNLLTAMRNVISPAIDFRFRGKISLDLRSFERNSVTAEGLAADLVLQNYDKIFAVMDLGVALPLSAVDEARLLALAALNVGDLLAANKILAKAESGCSDPNGSAHIAYLQGLICAKRHYELIESDKHHQRGLKYVTGLNSDAANLERAWLLNGLALNDALRWRRDPEGWSHSYASAFQLVREAFSLVADLSTPHAAYLRFNLIANMSFLVEMKGDYGAAARALERTFELDGGPPPELGADIAYRLGVLWFRADSSARAREYLLRSSEDTALDWARKEVVLRAFGALEKKNGSSEQAVRHHLEGARICLDARARHGAMHHAASVLEIEGESTNSHQILDELIESGVTEMELKGHVLSPPPFKATSVHSRDRFRESSSNRSQSLFGPRA